MGLLGIKLCLEAKGVAGAQLDDAAAFAKASQYADIGAPTKTCFCAAMAADDSKL